MNILYLTTHLNTGGISSYLLSLAKGLKARGHKVYIGSSSGELVDKFKEAGIIFFPIPIKTKQEVHPKILLSYFKLLSFVRENKIDIIHSNTRVTQVLGEMLGNYLKIPYLSTCHGFFKNRLSRRLFPCWGDKVIAISPAVKEHLIRDFHVLQNKIQVVYNGIDFDKFREPRTENRESVKKELGLGSGPVIGIVARLSDVKGHVYLIEAMKGILVEFPQAQLFIIGQGKEEARLVKLVNSLGIGKNTVFLPSADTVSVLSIMDIFVMPSLNEGLGLGLMEAMAQGLAVVGSAVGGILNLIQHNHSGLLVQPKDVKGLSCAIIELLRDFKKREFLGVNARNFIRKNFSCGKMVLETEKEYQECLNK